jgi:ribosomal protein L37AE/L43A
MVRLQSNKWVWPDDIVVDGRGTERVDVCAACELPFYRRAGSGELICDRCNAESFGTATRATEPPDTKTFPRHRYPKG